MFHVDLDAPHAAAPVVRMVTACGRDLAPDAARWFLPADAADRCALEGLDGPVLDIGSGPGRIVAHLIDEGIAALGVDIGTHAARWSSAMGVPMLHQSIFDPIPASGSWAGAVLMDGNIGIGGAPDALLARVREVLARSGRVVVEVAGPGTEMIGVEAHIHIGDVEVTDWFPWAVVSIDDIGAVADRTGFQVTEQRRLGSRHFALLAPR